MTLGQDLPVRDAIPALKAALSAGRSAVLEAPPGAGKTTLVPLELRGESWLGGRTILMLEPRRIAARAAAARMAAMIGESVGQTVGYRVRQEVRVSSSTQIEVLTEALLTRRLQHDPALEGVGLVIFDEFHERSLHADLGLALALETQAALNPDLRLLVMSATLDGDRVARLLGGAAVIRSEGRLFPIETTHLPAADLRDTPRAVAAAARQALRETTGSVLAFLPGEGEIRSTSRLLEDLPASVQVVPLYGNLAFDAQTAAIAPPPQGTRKLVLATAIAETSLTIPGVRAVVDSGLSRLARFDPASGMTRLVTERLSLASANQRRGRAGRTAPGHCYRLWSEATERSLPAYAPPEIALADLAPLALEFAAWGNAEPSAYALLDPPPSAAYAQALELLRELEALDSGNRITLHGRALNEIGLHPRLAHMIVRADARGEGGTALALAALLSERDVLRPSREQPDADLRSRLIAFDRGGAAPTGEIDRGAIARARDNAAAWARQLRIKDRTVDPDAAGRLLALAYPDRIAQARGPRGAFRLRNGKGALLPAIDALAGEAFLAVGSADQTSENARIFLAAPVSREDIDIQFGLQIETTDEIAWEPRSEIVAARRIKRLGALILEERQLDRPDTEKIRAGMLAGIAITGLSRLPWTDDLRQLQHRAAFLNEVDGDDASLADISESALAGSLDDWLGPYLDGISRMAQLSRIDLRSALEARLGWKAVHRLDVEAPTHLTVPSGSRLAIDYSSGRPVLAVRLQEMFGTAATPTVARGRVPVTLHLLSPARRPMQITTDLGGFWARSYPDVRKELKGRYPKHRWPDDPLKAQASSRAKRPGEQDST